MITFDNLNDFIAGLERGIEICEACEIANDHNGTHERAADAIQEIIDDLRAQARAGGSLDKPAGEDVN